MKVKKSTPTAKKSSCTPKPQPPHNPCETVAVSGGVTPKGVPNAEGGPSAWQIFEASATGASRILQYALSMMARKPKRRYLFTSIDPTIVFIISDTDLSDRQREIAASLSSVNVGTYSESMRLAEKARWLQLPDWVTKAEIASLAANEVQALRTEDDSIQPPDVVFLVWKQRQVSFAGATMLEIGCEIRDVVFTFGTESVPAFDIHEECED